MRRSDFLARFGLALRDFSSRENKSELHAINDAIRAGLPLLAALPHSQTTQSLLVAAEYPDLREVEGAKAWKALPWWTRTFGRL